MEYFREPNNKIQADFALNAGKLLKQYLDLSSKKNLESKYDATLTICVLQSLLTNCAELLSAMKKNQRKTWDEHIPDIPHRWGIKRYFIVNYTFKPNLTYSEFLTHLRNSLSHPTSTDKPPHYKVTGYTTVPDSSGIISKFQFIDSPWVDRGKLMSWTSSMNKESIKKRLEKFAEIKASGVEIKKSPDGKYEIYKKDQIYYPVFEAEISLSELVDLAIELANFLAQPVRKDWDGRTIERLIG
jgi:hypothetical protein